MLEHRGPDKSQHHVFPLSRNSQGVMQGYVLHLRGTLTPQPVTDDEGNSLLWNGEIFGGIQVLIISKVIYFFLLICLYSSTQIYIFFFYCIKWLVHRKI